MITIGIDPSINSTGMCVRSSDSPETYKYYIICSKMSGKMKSFIHNRIQLIDYGKKSVTGLEYPDKEYIKSENIYRIVGNIGEILDLYTMDNSLDHNEIYTGDSGESDEGSDGSDKSSDSYKNSNKKTCKGPNIIVNMEGISYGSVGSAALADLAGLNFAIRMMLISKGIKFRIVSPISLKVFATNNAGASKEEMSWAWKLLDKEMGDIDKIKIDDLADAYFLCRYVPD